MRIIALDNYDNRVEGEEYDAPDHQAQQLIAKGLAKAGKVPQNKMAPESENKANPSQAAGEERPSSASRAAQASAATTAEKYPGGGLVTPDPKFATSPPSGVTQRARKKAAAKKAPAKKATKKTGG
jgi:hypothetical protein